MKRSLLLVCFGLCLLASSVAFRPHGEGTLLRFNTAHLDLPALDEDAYFTYYYRFTNTGSTSVRILGVESSHRCLSVTVPTAPIPAGATDSIKVVLSTHDRIGPSYKAFTVLTDESFWSFYILSLRADIQHNYLGN